MKNLVAQIDTKATELDVSAVCLRAWEPVFISISFTSCLISASIVLDVGSSFASRHLTGRSGVGF